MRLRTLIKQFTWESTDRPDIVLGTDTRLNEKTHRAQLLFDEGGGTPRGSGAFPLTADLFVKSRLTTPVAVRRWIGFEAFAVIPRDTLGVDTALLQFRLDNGTDEFFHNGVAWVVATATDWNTEQQVADNIFAFDVLINGQSLRVVVNLVTFDDQTTPELIEVRVAYEVAEFDYQGDIIYRSLIPLLRTQVRPIARVVVRMPATGATLNISDLRIETGYNIVDVDSIFDFDAATDQLLMRKGFIGAEPNLLLSFVVGTGVITLTGSVTAGVKLYVRLILEPEVSVWSGQELDERSRVPGLRLTDIELLDAREVPAGECAVANKAAATAVVVPSPQQGNLQFTLLGETAGGVDHQRLLEEVNKFFFNNPFVTSTGIDEKYRLHLIDEYVMGPEPGQNEIHRGEAVFQVANFRRWLRDSFTENIATGTPTGSENSDVGLNANVGEAIEGREPWTVAYAVDDANTFFWRPIGNPGLEFTRIGSATAWQRSTGRLASRGLGARRIDKAIGGRSDFAMRRTLAGFPAIPADFHLRLIFREPAALETAVLFRYFIDASNFLEIARVDNNYSLTTRVSGSSYTSTIDLIGKFGVYHLLDWNYDQDGNAGNGQHNIFLTGVDQAVAGHVATLGGLAADGTLSLFANELAAANSATLETAFLGIAIGRNLTLAQHQADQSALGL